MNYCQLEIKERITISPPPWFALPATIGFPQTICQPSISTDQTLPIPTTSSAQRVGFFNIGSGRVGYWTKYR